MRTIGVEMTGDTDVKWDNLVTVSVSGFQGLEPWSRCEIDLGMKLVLPSDLGIEVRLSERFRAGGMYVLGWQMDSALRVMCSSSGNRISAGFVEFEVEVVERKVVSARFVVLSRGKDKGAGDV